MPEPGGELHEVAREEVEAGGWTAIGKPVTPIHRAGPAVVREDAKVSAGELLPSAPGEQWVRLITNLSRDPAYVAHRLNSLS